MTVLDEHILFQVFALPVDPHGLLMFCGPLLTVFIESVFMETKNTKH